MRPSMNMKACFDVHRSGKRFKKVSVKMFAAGEDNGAKLIGAAAKKEKKKLLSELPTSAVKRREFDTETFYPPQIVCQAANGGARQLESITAGSHSDLDSFGHHVGGQEAEKKALEQKEESVKTAEF